MATRSTVTAARPKPPTLPTLSRREVVPVLLHGRGDGLVVTGLGTTCYDAYAAGDHPLTFYNWAGMGGAAMVGLGLAIAQPERRVLVLTGDGEMLMGLGSLATIACERPRNLAIVVMDNERYLETGAQTTHTARGVDLAGIARAAGFATAATVRDIGAVRRVAATLWRKEGPSFFTIKVSPVQPPMTLPTRDGPYIRSRFREALLGRAAHWS